MSRLTVRLPDTLHEQLSDMAESEGISLNQYIVYALTRQVTLAYTVRPTSASEAIEQRAAYTALLQSLGQATFEETEAVMREREEVAPERELSPQVVKHLQERLAHQVIGSSQI
jgi:predicted DsbA family dithiol-disulfide isomerase